MTHADAPTARIDVESAIAAIWRDVLGIEEIAPDEDFYTLGGHSLTASRVTSRIRRTLGVEIPLTAFFAHPTVASLTDLVVADRAGDAAP